MLVVNFFALDFRREPRNHRRKLYDKSGRGIYTSDLLLGSKNASSALCLGESPSDHLSYNLRTSAWG